MTKEEKELLLKDLCARLPYGVKCNAFLKQIDGSLKSVFGKFKGYNGWADIGNNLVDIKTVKPYLRPMSSMTEEERLELSKLSDNNFKFYLYTREHEIICYEKYNYLEGLKVLDWLNENKFDYRGLIPMGLALEASEDMYK